MVHREHEALVENDLQRRRQRLPFASDSQQQDCCRGGPGLLLARGGVSLAQNVLRILSTAVEAENCQSGASEAVAPGSF